jgi:hypothetical protein
MVPRLAVVKLDLAEVDRQLLFQVAQHHFNDVLEILARRQWPA